MFIAMNRFRVKRGYPTGPLYLEHPKFESFEVRQTVTHKAAVA